MQPYNLDILLSNLQPASEDVILYLPRTSDIRQLALYAKQSVKLKVVHFCVEGASKANRPFQHQIAFAKAM